MKRIKFTILSLIIPVMAMAQTAVSLESELKDANNKIVSLEAVVKQQGDDIIFLKDALKLRNSNPKLNIENWEITLTSVVGNKDTNELHVNGIVVNNNKEGERLQFSTIDIVDPQGTRHRSYSFTNNKGGSFPVDRSSTSIPYAFKAIVKDVTDHTPVLALIQLKIYRGNGEEIYNFKGVDVTWN